MNSAAQDVAIYLVAGGASPARGGNSAWSSHVAAEPAAPDSVVTVYDTGGQDPDTEQLDMERPTFQVRVRSASYDDAYQKQREIRDLLIYDAPIDMTTSRFIGISMTTDILSIGRDDLSRHVLVVNYAAIRIEKE